MAAYEFAIIPAKYPTVKSAHIRAKHSAFWPTYSATFDESIDSSILSTKQSAHPISFESADFLANMSADLFTYLESDKEFNLATNLASQ